MNNTIRWGCIQPLIGGALIGATEAFGSDPEFIVSYTNTMANQTHLFKNYEKLTDRYFCVEDLPELSDIGKFNDLNNDIDVMIGVPVCSALSRLNKNASAEYGSVNNIYALANWTLSTVKPKAYIFENAPALFTPLGKPVLDKLNEIAAKFGYSSSIIYTDTQKHGIPQRRHRSFYIFWQSDTAPIVNYYNTTPKHIIDYLKEIPNYTTHNNTDIIEHNFQLNWLLEKYGPDFRNVVTANRLSNITFYTFLISCGNIEDENSVFNQYYQYCIANDAAKEVRMLDHIITKLAMGKGVWDTSLLFVINSATACMGKNTGRTLHPTENRLINIREWMHLMGLPHDFELVDPSQAAAIGQNVPVTTARDWCIEVGKFINNELPMSDFKHLKQHNIKRSYENMGDPIQSAKIIGL